ncbi:MAG: polysaccharide biosynthesis/export family protein [Planctomycetota bacterium]
MRLNAFCVLLALTLTGCTTTSPRDVEQDFDYPHQVYRVDVQSLLAGDLRYNMEIRDGDVLIPSNNTLFEDKADDPSNPKIDRVIPSRPEPLRYEIKPGDLLLVTIYELRTPGVDDQQQCRVDGHGWIRLDIVGPFHTQGLSPAELEQVIATRLEDAILLRDPTVSVQVLEYQWSYTVQIPMAEYQTTYSVKNNRMRLLGILTKQGLQGIEDYRYVYLVRKQAKD